MENKYTKYAMMVAELLQYEKANDYFNMTTSCRNDFQKAVYDAIEKQIELPPKLLKKDLPNEPWKLNITCEEMGQCPDCFAVATNSENYCSNCGRALNWESVYGNQNT